MPDLIGVNAAAGRRSAARPRLPCRPRRRAALPRRAPRHRLAPVAARRLPDRARQRHFPRGEPVSVRIAPSVLSADFAALGDDVRMVAARRRRLDSRRRDGRPVRPQHQHRHPGRGGPRPGLAAAAGRAPDDRGAGDVRRRVRRGRRRVGVGSCRGDRSPAPARAPHPAGRRPSGCGDQSGHAARHAGRHCPGPRHRDPDVGQPGLRRPDVHRALLRPAPSAARPAGSHRLRGDHHRRRRGRPGTRRGRGRGRRRRPGGRRGRVCARPIPAGAIAALRTAGQRGWQARSRR